MKTHATAIIERDEQQGLPILDLKIEFQIKELGLDIDLVPFREKKKLNNVEEYVLKEIENRNVVFKTYDKDGRAYDMDVMAAMTEVIDIIYSALAKCSDEWRKPFHVNIIDPKLKIKEYGNKWATMISQLDAVKWVVESDPHMDKLDEILEAVQKISTSKVVVWGTSGASEITTQPLELEAPQAPAQQRIPQTGWAFDLSSLIPESDPDYATIN